MAYVKIVYPNSGSGSGGGITDHNDLSGLQGGLQPDEFYHLKKSQYDLLDAVIQASIIHPSYTQPSSSLNINSNTFEIGSTQVINITQTFNKNDAGNKTSEFITKNGTIVTNTNTFTENLFITSSNVVYGGYVNYSQGLCNKTNNLGNIDCTNQIPAGTVISPIKTISGALRRYSGSIDNFPISGTELRNKLLSSSVLNTANNFTFNTGTTNKRFLIAIPGNKTLISVQNTGTNEFLNFITYNTISFIPDASGTNQAYKVYVLENAVPFSSNYTLNVTII